MALLTDGFKTLINLAAVPGAGVTFREKEVTPPGLDSGGELDTTTMRNTRWRTKQPKKLITATEMKSTVQYDPEIYASVVAAIGVNGTIQVTFPDGATLTIWGWLDKFIPNAHKEGEFTTAEITLHCSNQDNNGVEVAPLYLPAL